MYNPSQAYPNPRLSACFTNNKTFFKPLLTHTYARGQSTATALKPAPLLAPCTNLPLLAPCSTNLPLLAPCTNLLVGTTRAPTIKFTFFLSWFYYLVFFSVENHKIKHESFAFPTTKATKADSFSFAKAACATQAGGVLPFSSPSLEGRLGKSLFAQVPINRFQAFLTPEM